MNRLFMQVFWRTGIYCKGFRKSPGSGIIVKAFIPFVVVLFLLSGCSSKSSDWPMWRGDPGRRASPGIMLPQNIDLLWTRQLEEPKRCWPFQYEDYYTSGNPDQIGKLSFDISYEPVMGNGKLFVPSMVSDRLTAYSAKSGKELWRYYANGPVRFAPVYDSETGRVFFVSDDGYLYCLKGRNGKLLWRYKGSYSERKVLGNERIISMWPARGGPVLKDGVIYFASGVIPFEGTFIHAVDAQTGNKIWSNSSSGSHWGLHQHGGAYSYGGPSPQGYLAISGNKLIVPGGRTPPAVFDRTNGDFLYFNQASGMVGKGAGGYRAFASDNWFFNHGMLYSLEDGAQYGHVPGDVITRDAFIGTSGNKLVAHHADIKKTEIEIADRLEKGAIRKSYEVEEWWNLEIPGLDHLYLKTDSHFVVSRNNGEKASLVSVTRDGKPGEVVWDQKIDGEVWTMFAGDEKLFIVSRTGKIYCFGAAGSINAKHYAYEPENDKPDSKSSELAASILEKIPSNGGYGMIYGADNIEFIKALADNSSIHFVIVEPDAKKVEKLRRYFDDLGLYGKRLAVIPKDKNLTSFLPYIFDLIVVNKEELSEQQMHKTFNSLRPYGGTAFFMDARDGSSKIISRFLPENGELEVADDFIRLSRNGALPGSAPWTHQYASAANRTYSDDELVRLPLGTLWFGGPSNRNVLPRHHLGPIPQAAGGRLFLLGVETLSARCVYTGRELWVKELPGIGHPFTDLELEERFRTGHEVYMSNHPGANFIGSPYVSLEDVVYVIYNDRLLTLDATTGELKIEFRLPQIPGMEVNEFSHILVSGDYLITAVDPQMFDDGQPGKIDNWNATSSRVLLVMNRHTGEVLWTKRAQRGFRHNAIVAGNNHLFLIDGLSEGVVELHRRRGEDISGSQLIGLDLETGRELWSKNGNVFGTFLGYYEDKDILIEAGRYGGKKNLPDEPRNHMTAHRGSTGNVLWESSRPYSGALGLHPEMVIPGKPGESVLNPLTGEPVRKDHPLTGEEYSWTWHKYYGCGTINSSKHLMSFRSGSAGYNDLQNFGGTGNFSGWKAGCTNNLIAAEGILNGPDYTRTCTCSYPLQCSFGLAHMPDAGIEMWTMNRIESGSEAIRKLGINLGAPGNRKEAGVLWLEYPKAYPEGADIPVEIESDSIVWYKNHETWMENRDEKYNWVGSYGAKGITSISVALIPYESSGELSYTVTLFFTEPENVSSGERIFDVSIQGKKVLENFDILKEAGGPRCVLRREFRGVKVQDKLTIELLEKINNPVIAGVKIELEDFEIFHALNAY